MRQGLAQGYSTAAHLRISPEVSQPLAVRAHSATEGPQGRPLQFLLFATTTAATTTVAASTFLLPSRYGAESRHRVQPCCVLQAMAEWADDVNIASPARSGASSREANRLGTVREVVPLWGLCIWSVAAL